MNEEIEMLVGAEIARHVLAVDRIVGKPHRVRDRGRPSDVVRAHAIDLDAEGRVPSRRPARQHVVIDHGVTDYARVAEVEKTAPQSAEPFSIERIARREEDDW